MPSDLRTGTMLAGFRVDSLIGEGAMGSVYLAEDTRRGGRVALKVLTGDLAEDDRFRRRFLRESKLAASLDHPHVVPVVDAGEEDGVLYLAMGLVEGSDLRELLRREGRLDPDRAIGLVGQAAEALDAAHVAGLVHRDVKPANILIRDEPEGEHAYVCDFGLARHLSSSSLTTDRDLVGTIDYIPPEQIEGGDIDGRADVYSLGCVLFECLAGIRPFDRESELSVVFAHLNERPPRLSDHRPDLPEAFDEVFRTALAKSADDRYSTCEELTVAACAALDGKALARRRPRRRHLLVLTGAAAAFAAVAAVGGLVALRGSDATPTISEIAIGGLALGLADTEYERAWGPSAMTALRYPEDYASRTFPERKRTVYYASGDIQGAIRRGGARAVEITTWNESDRTEKGVGPCSTVEQLKDAYGNALEPVPGNIIKGKVYGYTVGKRLFFGVGPLGNPTRVGVVALYSNPLQYAGFNALNSAPCV
jgi:Protein kinase domain